MPTIELTLKQLVAAAHQLTPSEFKQFLQDMSELSRARWARHADEATLRAAVNYRWPARKQQRLNKLLRKGNAGMLTPVEDAELKILVDEVEQKSLEKADAMYELLQRGIDLRRKLQRKSRRG